MTPQQKQRYRVKQLEIQFLSSCTQNHLPRQYTKFVLGNNSVASGSLKHKQQTLRHQLQKVLSKQTLPQEIQKIMESREIIVGLLRNLLLHNRKSKKAIDLDTVCRYVQTVRQLSLEIIQRLSKWLKFIGQATQQSQQSRVKSNFIASAKAQKDPFTKKTLFKISSDIDFLRYSALRKHIQFSNSNDPLFLYPLRKFWSLSLTSNYNSRPVINLFQISENLKMRLQRANQFLKSGLDITEAQSLEGSQVQQSDYSSQQNDRYDQQGQDVVETKNNSIIYKLGGDYSTEKPSQRKLKSISLSPYDSNIKRAGYPENQESQDIRRMTTQQREIIYLPNIKEKETGKRNSKQSSSVIEPYIKQYKKRERSKNTHSEQQMKKQRQLQSLKKKYGIPNNLETQEDESKIIPAKKATLQPINPQKKWIHYEYQQQEDQKNTRTNSKNKYAISYDLNERNRIYHRQADDLIDSSKEPQSRTAQIVYSPIKAGNNQQQQKYAKHNNKSILVSNSTLEKLKSGERLSKEDRINLQLLARSRLQSQIRRKELIDQQKRKREGENLQRQQESARKSLGAYRQPQEQSGRNNRNGVIRSRVISSKDNQGKRAQLFHNSQNRKEVRYGHARKGSKNQMPTHHNLSYFEGASGNEFLQDESRNNNQPSQSLKKLANKESNRTIKKTNNLVKGKNPKRKRKNMIPGESSENEDYYQRKRHDFLNRFKKFNFKAAQDEIKAINKEFLDREKELKQEKQREHYYKRKMMYQRGLKPNQDEQIYDGSKQQNQQDNNDSRLNQQSLQQDEQQHGQRQQTKKKQRIRRELPQTKGKNQPKSRNKDQQEENIQITDRKRYLQIRQDLRSQASRAKNSNRGMGNWQESQESSPQRLNSGQLIKIKKDSGKSLSKKDRLLTTVNQKEQKQVELSSDWSMEKDRSVNKIEKQKHSKNLTAVNKDKDSLKNNNLIKQKELKNKPSDQKKEKFKKIQQEKLQNQQKKVQSMDKKIKKLEQKIDKQKSSNGLENSRSIKGIEGKIIKNGSPKNIQKYEILQYDQSQSPQRRKLRPLNQQGQQSSKSIQKNLNLSKVTSPIHYKKQEESYYQDLQQILNKNRKIPQQEQMGDNNNRQNAGFSRQSKMFKNQNDTNFQEIKRQKSFQSASKKYLTIKGNDSNQKQLKPTEAWDKQATNFEGNEVKKGKPYFMQKDLVSDNQLTNKNNVKQKQQISNQSDQQLEEADKRALKKYQKSNYNQSQIGYKNQKNENVVETSMQTYDILSSKKESRASIVYQNSDDKTKKTQIQQQRKSEISTQGKQSHNFDKKNGQKNQTQQQREYKKHLTGNNIQQNQKIHDKQKQAASQYPKYQKKNSEQQKVKQTTKQQYNKQQNIHKNPMNSQQKDDFLINRSNKSPFDQNYTNKYPQMRKDLNQQQSQNIFSGNKPGQNNQSSKKNEQTYKNYMKIPIQKQSNGDAQIEFRHSSNNKFKEQHEDQRVQNKNPSKKSKNQKQLNNKNMRNQSPPKNIGASVQKQNSSQQNEDSPNDLKHREKQSKLSKRLIEQVKTLQNQQKSRQKNLNRSKRSQNNGLNNVPQFRQTRQVSSNQLQSSKNEQNVGHKSNFFSDGRKNQEGPKQQQNRNIIAQGNIKGAKGQLSEQTRDKNYQRTNNEHMRQRKDIQRQSSHVKYPNEKQIIRNSEFNQQINRNQRFPVQQGQSSNNITQKEHSNQHNILKQSQKDVFAIQNELPSKQQIHGSANINNLKQKTKEYQGKGNQNQVLSNKNDYNQDKSLKHQNKSIESDNHSAYKEKDDIQYENSSPKAIRDGNKQWDVHEQNSKIRVQNKSQPNTKQETQKTNINNNYNTKYQNSKKIGDVQQIKQKNQRHSQLHQQKAQQAEKINQNQKSQPKKMISNSRDSKQKQQDYNQQNNLINKRIQQQSYLNGIKMKQKNDVQPNQIISLREDRQNKQQTMNKANKISNPQFQGNYSTSKDYANNQAKKQNIKSKQQQAQKSVTANNKQPIINGQRNIKKQQQKWTSNGDQQNNSQNQSLEKNYLDSRNHINSQGDNNQAGQGDNKVTANQQGITNRQSGIYQNLKHRQGIAGSEKQQQNQLVRQKEIKQQKGQQSQSTKANPNAISNNLQNQINYSKSQYKEQINQPQSSTHNAQMQNKELLQNHYNYEPLSRKQENRYQKSQQNQSNKNFTDEQRKRQQQTVNRKNILNKQVNDVEKQIEQKQKIIQHENFQQKMQKTHSIQKRQQLQNEPNQPKFEGPVQSQIKTQQKNSARMPVSNNKASIIFKSISYNERQLIDYLQKLIPKSSKYMNQYLNTQYFEKRQLATTVCSYGQQPVLVALTHSKFTETSSRNLYVVFFKLINDKYKSSEGKFLSAFLKYLFTNDPTQHIIFLLNKQFRNEALTSMLQQSIYFQGKIKQPLEISDSFVSKTAILLTRNFATTSKFQELYSSILNTQIVFVTKNSKLQKTEEVPSSLEKYKIKISDTFRLTIENAIKNRKGVEQFRNLQKLNQHLDGQELMEFSQQDLQISNQNTPLISGNFLYYQDFKNIKFCFITNLMHISIDLRQPDENIFYREFDDIFVMLLRSNQSGMFYLFLDNLYEDSTNDAIKCYMDNVQGKNLKEVFDPRLSINASSTSSSKDGKKLVTIPKFQKEIVFPVDQNQQVKCCFSMSLNWKQYVKGVRKIDERQVSAEMIAPFNVGLVRLNPSGNLKYLFISEIEEKDENQEF